MMLPELHVMTHVGAASNHLEIPLNLETMRAAVYHGANDVRVEQIPIPSIGPGEALVRIRACGVCGTDLKKIHYGLVPGPRVFGHEMAGDIVALGEGVQGWNVGDRVVAQHHVPCFNCYYCHAKSYAQCPGYKRTGTTAGFEPAGGGFAEYIRVMDWVVERGMVRMPDHASYDEATFVEPVNTVLKAVRKLKPQKSETALVMGQGQIGLLFTQLLRMEGACVIGADPMPERRKIAQKLGAGEAVDSNETLAAKVKDLTDGRGADLAIVAVPSEEAVRQAFAATRPDGRILLFAHTRLQDFLPIDGGEVCMLEKDFMGSYSSDIELQDECARLIFDRVIDVQSLITSTFSLDQTVEAIELASHPTAQSLKVMVHP
jgi:L-iditol 2-dehydrogenase